MGPEAPLGFKDDFSHLMQRWGGTHQWKTGFDYSYIPFAGRPTNSPFGSWTFPKDTVYNADDTSTFPTQYTESLPTYANIPTHTFAIYVQDDWQVARRSDLEPRAALRPAEGRVQREHPDLLAQDRGQARTQRLVPAAIRSCRAAHDRRGDSQQLRPARRLRLGSAAATA